MNPIPRDPRCPQTPEESEAFWQWLIARKRYMEYAPLIHADMSVFDAWRRDPSTHVPHSRDVTGADKDFLRVQGIVWEETDEGREAGREDSGRPEDCPNDGGATVPKVRAQRRQVDWPDFRG